MNEIRCKTCKGEVRMDLQYVQYLQRWSQGSSTQIFCCGMCADIYTLKEMITHHINHEKHILNRENGLGEAWYPVINQLRDQLIRIRNTWIDFQN